MQRPLLLLVPALALLAEGSAQGPEAGTDWRLPFRNPMANLEPPAEMYEHLRRMQHLARTAPEDAAWFDENGVEIVDDPRWQQARERLQKTRQDAGYLSLVIRDSRSAPDRATAFYGSFYLPDPALVMQMIEHIPGEPVRALREDAYRRAIAFLRVHLPKRNDGDIDQWRAQRVGPAGQRPPEPGQYSFGFDLLPFAKLLDVDDYRDWIQALWFFGKCIEIRPELHLPVLDLTKDALREVIASEEPGVLDAVREFLQIADPKHREPPPLDASRRRYQRWLERVLHDVFPPIRHISTGLTELHPSDDLDRIIAVGKELLVNGSIGDSASGKLATGSFYRGLRIARTPEPLDKLGLQIGWVVTAINGVPVAKTEDVARVFDSSPAVRSFIVEYVQGGELRAREFRLVR